MCIRDRLKSQTPPSHFRALFNEIVNSYPNRLLCFTDGSKRGNRVGCAYSINRVEFRTFVIEIHQPFFTAELQPIHHCLIDLMNLPPSSHPQNFLITSDSVVALLAIQDVNSSHPLVQRIHIQLNLKPPNHHVTFVWTSGPVSYTHLTLPTIYSV